MGKMLFTGRSHSLHFYRSGGQVYVRRAGLSGRRVKAEKIFRVAIVHRRLLGKASRIASMIYKALPETFREHWMLRAFTGEALSLLKRDKGHEEAFQLLWQTYVQVWVDKEVAKAAEKEHAAGQLIKWQKTIHPGVLPFTIHVPGHVMHRRPSCRRFVKLTNG